MAKYKMENGAFVDTKNAVNSWGEATYWNGNNHISKATGSQWNHEELHKSRKGNYYIERWSQWQGSTPSAEFATEEEAARWLIHNEHELPGDLKSHEATLCE